MQRARHATRDQPARMGHHRHTLSPHLPPRPPPPLCLTYEFFALRVRPLRFCSAGWPETRASRTPKRFSAMPSRSTRPTRPPGPFIARSSSFPSIRRATTAPCSGAGRRDQITVHACAHVRMRACVHMHMRACMHARICVPMCVCVHVHVCMYGHCSGAGRSDRGTRLS